MPAKVVFLVLFEAARRAVTSSENDWVQVHGQSQWCDTSSQKIAGEQGVALDECQDRCKCESACFYFHWKSNAKGGWCSRYTTCNLQTRTPFTTYVKLSQPACQMPTPMPTPAPTVTPSPTGDNWVDEHGQGQRCDLSSQKIVGEQGVPLNDCRDRCKCDTACFYYHWTSNAQGGWCSRYTTCNLETKAQYTTYVKLSQPACLAPTPPPTSAPLPMELPYHLAPAGAVACDSGVSPTRDQCMAAVQLLAESVGATMGRTELQSGSGGTCLTYGWGQVPAGCSAQTGGDWAAHYKYGAPMAEGCAHAMYQLVCYEPEDSAQAPTSADCASDIDGGGWTLVRHTKGTGRWGPWDDNLEGTSTVGVEPDAEGDADWTIPWSSPDEFLFALGDCSLWLIAEPSAVIGTFYSNSERQILKSSSSSTPYYAKWYNRASAPEDPWVSVRDHAKDILYGEASRNSHNKLKNAHGGANVYVRTGTGTQGAADYDLIEGSLTLGGVAAASVALCGAVACLAIGCGSRGCRRKRAPGQAEAEAGTATDFEVYLSGASEGQGEGGSVGEAPPVDEERASDQEPSPKNSTFGLGTDDTRSQISLDIPIDTFGSLEQLSDAESRTTSKSSTIVVAV